VVALELSQLAKPLLFDYENIKSTVCVFANTILLHGEMKKGGSLYEELSIGYFCDINQNIVVEGLKTSKDGLSAFYNPESGAYGICQIAQRKTEDLYTWIEFHAKLVEKFKDKNVVLFPIKIDDETHFATTFVNIVDNFEDSLIIQELAKDFPDKETITNLFTLKY